MCGRFTLRTTPERVAEYFDLDETPVLAPRFNIAPGQAVATISRGAGGARRSLELRRWGLVPRWATDARIGQRLINARAETVAEKPAFRDALRKRRCLVPADGFYEWSGRRAARQPYLIERPDGAPFALAGLWERWSGSDGAEIQSCTLITTAANDRLRPLHDRMPVILAPSDHARWLDPELRDAADVSDLLRACPDAWLELRPVSPRVNDVANDDPSCVEPAYRT